jgi:hypothetical protein
MPTELTLRELKMDELRLSRFKGSGGGSRGETALGLCVLLNVLAVVVGGALLPLGWMVEAGATFGESEADG